MDTALSWLVLSLFCLGMLAHFAPLIDSADSSSSSGADLGETLKNQFSVSDQEPDSDSSWETTLGCSGVLHDVDKFAYCFFYNFGYQPGHFDGNLDDLKDQASWEKGYEVISNFIQTETGCDIARFKLIQQSIGSSEEIDNDKTGCLQYKTLSSSIPAIHIQQTLTGSYNNFPTTFNPEADVCSKNNSELQSTESSLTVYLDEDNQLQVEINAYAGHTVILLSESRHPEIGIQRWLRLHCYTCGAFLDVVEHCKKRKVEYGNAGCGGPVDDSYGVIPGDKDQSEEENSYETAGKPHYRRGGFQHKMDSRYVKECKKEERKFKEHTKKSRPFRKTQKHLKKLEKKSKKLAKHSKKESQEPVEDVMGQDEEPKVEEIPHPQKKVNPAQFAVPDELVPMYYQNKRTQKKTN